MTKTQLESHLETCHLLIEAILQSIKLAEANVSKKKFNDSLKELNKRIDAYKNIQR